MEHQLFYKMQKKKKKKNKQMDVQPIGFDKCPYIFQNIILEQLLAQQIV